ncbi:MAG: hypothetical protein PHO87_06030 [Acholeplasmataceae bacterium]|jgi:hypothetical protein|nr:hypothetical protein [Acholeplasmataceae bacterium]MDD4469426.1 hypothetical protein [Acholeplasmataceae bacterium]
MKTKKTTTKKRVPKTKKPMKTIIIKREDTIKEFDFSFKDPQENLKIVAILKDLQTHEGWRFMQEAFQKNIEFLSNQILDKEDALSGKELTEEEVDELRMKRSYLKELLEKPKYFIDKLEDKPAQEDNLDPYD